MLETHQHQIREREDLQLPRVFLGPVRAFQVYLAGMLLSCQALANLRIGIYIRTLLCNNGRLEGRWLRASVALTGAQRCAGTQRRGCVRRSNDRSLFYNKLGRAIRRQPSPSAVAVKHHSTVMLGVKKLVYRGKAI